MLKIVKDAKKCTSAKTNFFQAILLWFVPFFVQFLSLLLFFARFWAFFAHILCANFYAQSFVSAIFFAFSISAVHLYCLGDLGGLADLGGLCDLGGLGGLDGLSGLGELSGLGGLGSQGCLLLPIIVWCLLSGVRVILFPAFNSFGKSHFKDPNSVARIFGLITKM